MTREVKPADDDRRGLIKAPQDFGAGVFLLFLAAIAWFGGWKLSTGTLNSIGPGLVPKSVALMIVAFGLLLIIQSFLTRGDLLERWSIREPFFVLGAVLIFAATIRTFGLVVAGPAAMIFSSFAERSTKVVQIVIYSIIMTICCVIMFKLLLGLPIPILPQGIHIKGLG